MYDDAQGRWRSPVAEEAFARYGFGYRVFHSGDVDVRWLRNVRYIADFLAIDSPPGVDQALARIRAVRSLPFGEAIWVLGTSRETWLWLIASAGVAVDFGTEQLDRPDLLALAWLHDSQATLECHRLAVGSSEERGVVRQLAYGSVVSMDPGSRVLLRGEPHTVVSRDADQVILRPGGYDEDPALGAVTLAVESVEALLASGDLQAVAPRPRDVVAACARVRLATVTDEERARAMRRWEAIGSYRETGKVPAGVPRRTLFRWLAWARVASAVHGSEFLGMFRRLEGTTGVNRISPEQRALLEEVAAAFHAGRYATERDGAAVPSRWRVSSAYSDYVALSRERGLLPRSQRALRREVRKYSLEQSERARRGRRAGDKLRAPVGRGFDLPVHGARPFEVAHVDHQVLDLWCVSGTSGAVLGRPWLTLIFDAFSRMPLGFTLRFDAPCVFSVMCATYDCVQRHNRFPDQIVADGGIEFDSPDFDLAMMYLRAAIVRRARSQPRFGALIESGLRLDQDSGDRRDAWQY